MKKLFCTLVAGMMLCSYLSACSGKKQPQQELTLDNVDIWGCDASTKVLQNFIDMETGETKPVDEGYYDSIKQEANIDITMLRGEYESGQIIITPDIDVAYYSAKISDLKLVDGDAIISAENIDVYHERYMPVKSSHSNTNVPGGYYPDALVPMSAIVEYEDNKIKANENQGIYVTVETKLDQQVGEYLGELTLDFKNFTKTVPVCVTVLDATISEETHLKSAYSAKWNFEQGELDTTQRAYDAYFDALKEYRLATPLRNASASVESANNYAERAYQELQDPRLSCVNIPIFGQMGQEFDMGWMENYLKAIAKKSFETEYNMFEKMYVYNGFMDEPVNTKVNVATLQKCCTDFNNLLNKLADQYEADATITAKNKNEIITSLREVPHVFTTHKILAYEGYIDTYCPIYSLLGTEEQRNEYFNDPAFKELWWYGCNNPVNPYVTFHLETEDTIGARMLGWMSAEYDISGILNWAINNYSTREDYFDWNSSHRGTGPHGEGFLFYPGGQYGLDEPIPSIRLSAIRDGIEEYELLYALKQKYVELGLDFKNFASSLTSNLYSGAQVIGKVENFVDARKTLLDASIALNGPAQLCLIDSKELGNGTVETKLYAKAGYELKNNGEVLTGGIERGEGLIYTIISKLDNAVNTLQIEYVAEGKTYTYTKSLPGRATIYNATEFYQKFKKDTVKVTSTLVDGATLGLESQLAKLDISAIEDDYQMFVLGENSVFEKFDDTVNKVVIAFYNDGEADVAITLDVKYKKEKLYTSLPQVMLESKKVTYIEIPMLNINWEKSGSLAHIRFTIGEAEGQPATTLYVKDIIVFDK